MCPKDADGMANIIDFDQTALSENLGSLYMTLQIR